MAAGTRLGAYEIVALIGAGGMGEVYRARDTRLNRDVAIKVLPDAFAKDPDRVARLQREAHLLAALNHPHIGGIHALDESGGIRFLALKLIDGESLAQRLASGPVPVTEALSIARQIVDALEAAHEKGIIHRDLKPANVMLTAENQVKVLDFGLAKATDAARPDLSNSPTLTAAATQAGVVLGNTAAYMSPEQAKGRAADKRSDVWAFGCILFEMLTGKRPFDGEDVSDTLAAVLRGEPDWNALPGDLPPAIRTMLKRCLEKDRRARIPDISVARFVMTDSESFAPPAPATTAAVHRAPRWQMAVLAALAVGGLAVGAWSYSRFRMTQTPNDTVASRFVIPPPEGAVFGAVGTIGQGGKT